jgi:PhnB protein
LVSDDTRSGARAAESWKTAHERWIDEVWRKTVTERQEQSTSISVMLIVPDAEAAVAWYKDALGASELWNLGGVAGLVVDGAPFFLHEVNPKNPSENSPGQLGITSTRIELFVEDPDRFMERAIASGASPGPELEDHQLPWGTHRQGGFRDPFGHTWSVGDRSPLSRQVQ